MNPTRKKSSHTWNLRVAASLAVVFVAALALTACNGNDSASASTPKGDIGIWDSNTVASEKTRKEICGENGDLLAVYFNNIESASVCKDALVIRERKERCDVFAGCAGTVWSEPMVLDISGISARMLAKDAAEATFHLSVSFVDRATGWSFVSHRRTADILGHYLAEAVLVVNWICGGPLSLPQQCSP